jgi:hypothetical protein
MDRFCGGVVDAFVVSVAGHQPAPSEGGSRSYGDRHPCESASARNLSTSLNSGLSFVFELADEGRQLSLLLAVAMAKVSTTKELKRTSVDLRHLDFRLKAS